MIFKRASQTGMCAMNQSSHGIPNIKEKKKTTMLRMIKKIPQRISGFLNKSFPLIGFIDSFSDSFTSPFRVATFHI